MESVQERYAAALFSLSKEENKVEQYQKEAKQVYLSLYENEEMVHLMSSYFLTEREKDSSIDKVFKSVSLPNLLNFLKVLCQNGRAYLVLSILRSFNKMVNEYKHVADGTVFSAKKLEKEEIQKVEEAVSKSLGVTVELTNQIDPTLIGGVKVVVGGKVFDGSIKNSLQGLKTSIIKGEN